LECQVPSLRKVADQLPEIEWGVLT
jgi:hypothetical protein